MMALQQVRAPATRSPSGAFACGSTKPRLQENVRYYPSSPGFSGGSGSAMKYEEGRRTDHGRGEHRNSRSPNPTEQWRCLLSCGSDFAIAVRVAPPWKVSDQADGLRLRMKLEADDGRRWNSIDAIRDQDGRVDLSRAPGYAPTKTKTDDRQLFLSILGSQRARSVMAVPDYEVIPNGPGSP